MRRHTLPLLFFLACIAPALTAQNTLPGWDAAALAKCDARTKMYLLNRSMPSERSGGLLSAREIRLFLTGDPSAVRPVVERLGGTVGGHVGRLMTASIPSDALSTLARDASVERIEMGAPMRTFNDSVRAHVRADEVIRGLPPLAATSTGKGVLVGIIDTGIDYRHPEFRELRDALSTRIVAMWGQGNGGGEHPENFGYGTEWRREEIQLACQESPNASVQEADIVGHGTHVAATAAGLHGMAPDAEIIMVQPRHILDVDWEDLAADVMDAALYIYETAEALGKPCVINASLGSYDHPQDGSDPLARAIDAMVAEKPGRFFFAAAGNSGRAGRHISSPGGYDRTLWSYTYGGSVLLRIPDTSLAHLALAIAVDSTTLFGQGPTVELGRSAARTGASLAAAGFTLDTLPGGNGPISSRVLKITASSLGNGSSEIRMEVPRSHRLVMRLIITGSGPFHAWGEELFGVTGPDFPTDADYVAPDRDVYSGTPAIGRNVIAVGSFVNRSNYDDAHGVPAILEPSTVGAISGFSSRGPTTDGRVKPDLTAPGENVLSARSRDLAVVDSNMLVPDPLMIAMSGTSMASPVVTGAVALYLQAHPGATVEEVRSALVGRARRDAATDADGPLPNGIWGYGKLDIFASMAADGDHAPWPSPVRLNQPVPNPVTGGSAFIGYVLERNAPATIAVYDMLGRRVAGETYESLGAGYHELRVDLSTAAPGAYRIELHALGARATGKLLLVR